MKMEDEQEWNSVDMENTSILEILLPNESIIVSSYENSDGAKGGCVQGVYRTGSNMPPSDRPSPQLKRKEQTPHPTKMTTTTSGEAIYRQTNGYPLINEMTLSSDSVETSPEKSMEKSMFSAQIEKDEKEETEKREREIRNHSIIPNGQAIVTLLAKIVDHIDTLLEDWYPDIGIR